jgi:hypothetical protein
MRSAAKDKTDLRKQTFPAQRSANAVLAENVARKWFSRRSADEDVEGARCFERTGSLKVCGEGSKARAPQDASFCNCFEIRLRENDGRNWGYGEREWRDVARPLRGSEATFTAKFSLTRSSPEYRRTRAGSPCYSPRLRTVSLKPSPLASGSSAHVRLSMTNLTG